MEAAIMAAKTLSEQLLALLDADGQAKLKAVFAANPALIAQDMKGTELVDVWAGFGGELEPPAAAHVPTLPSAATTSASATQPTTTSTTVSPTVSSGSTTTASTSNGAADGLAAVLAELQGLKAQMAKDYVPVSKLGEYRTEILTHAIKTADDYSTIRENHRAEFSEPLDRNAFESFVATQNQAGIKFSSLASAHDTFVKDKRVTASAAAEKSRIDAAVAEALKQQRSSNVPGQTQTSAMSPAQQVIAKAKAAASGNGNAESAAMKAARQLEELDRGRASVQ
jgi:hypothetical protein